MVRDYLRTVRSAIDPYSRFWRWDRFDSTLTSQQKTFEKRYRKSETPRQRIYKFPNGVEVSLINDGYGREAGLYEIWATDKPEVEGWLTEKQVMLRLHQVKDRKGK